MISEQGAILIATVIPIGLLIVAVETRTAVRFFLRDLPASVRLALAAVVGGIAGSAVWAVLLCVVAVSSESALRGADAAWVAAAGYALLVPVSLSVFAALSSVVSKED